MSGPVGSLAATVSSSQTVWFHGSSCQFIWASNLCVPVCQHEIACSVQDAERAHLTALQKSQSETQVSEIQPAGSDPAPDLSATQSAFATLAAQPPSVASNGSSISGSVMGDSTGSLPGEASGLLRKRSSNAVAFFKKLRGSKSKEDLSSSDQSKRGLFGHLNIGRKSSRLALTEPDDQSTCPPDAQPVQERAAATCATATSHHPGVDSADSTGDQQATPSGDSHSEPHPGCTTEAEAEAEAETSSAVLAAPAVDHQPEPMECYQWYHLPVPPNGSSVLQAVDAAIAAQHDAEASYTAEPLHGVYARGPTGAPLLGFDGRPLLLAQGVDGHPVVLDSSGTLLVGTNDEQLILVLDANQQPVVDPASRPVLLAVTESGRALGVHPDGSVINTADGVPAALALTPDGTPLLGPDNRPLLAADGQGRLLTEDDDDVWVYDNRCRLLGWDDRPLLLAVSSDGSLIALTQDAQPLQGMNFLQNCNLLTSSQPDAVDYSMQTHCCCRVHTAIRHSQQWHCT